MVKPTQPKGIKAKAGNNEEVLFHTYKHRRQGTLSVSGVTF